MDLSEELLHMAANAMSDDVDVKLSEIRRWMKIFGYSHGEAKKQIKEQQENYYRYSVHDDQWDLVRGQQEALGFSRKAYEHWIERNKRSMPSCNGQVQQVGARADSTYLILLGGLLDTPEKIQGIANLSAPLQTAQGITDTEDSDTSNDERSDAVFCRIDGTTKHLIEIWLSTQDSSYKNTFVRLSIAKKDLAHDSSYPTLSRDSTLPQFRQQSLQAPPSTTTIPVTQNQYPVWYFFYGTLADRKVLTRVLSSTETPSPDPKLLVAGISSGRVKYWGKYKALVDGSESDWVEGKACWLSKEQEEALRVYETEKYEVVRCCIEMADRTAQGLTFRFAGAL